MGRGLYVWEVGWGYGRQSLVGGVTGRERFEVTQRGRGDVEVGLGCDCMYQAPEPQHCGAGNGKTSGPKGLQEPGQGLCL